jgi:Sulfotransferase domain
MTRLNEVMMWNGAFEGKFLDKDVAINFFERHNQKVKDTIPPEKLLVFDVKEGWEPLCNFLNMPVPDHPFPNLNDTQAFNDRVQMMRVQHAVAPH